MKLYLAESEDPVEKGGAGSGTRQLGVSRGGKYVARVQVGYEKDNSPRYKYFETIDEYKEYLARQREEKKKKGKDKDEKDRSSIDEGNEEREGKKKRTKAGRSSLFVRR